jgi:hypothetical protein
LLGSIYNSITAKGRYTRWPTGGWHKGICGASITLFVTTWLNNAITAKSALPKRKHTGISAKIGINRVSVITLF